MPDTEALAPEILSASPFAEAIAPEIIRTIDTANIIETAKIPTYARQISAMTKAIKM